MTNGKWAVIEPPPKQVCCVMAFQKTKRIENRTEIICPECKTRYRRKGNGTWAAEDSQ